jgi:uncharacterized protein YggE
MKCLPFVLLCALPLSVPLLSATPRPEPQGPDREPMVVVNGDATIYVAPDQGKVGFGIETYDAGLDASKSKLDSAAKELLQALHTIGVQDDAIAIDLLEVQIEYLHDSAQNGITGYRVRRSYTVTLKDVSRFEALVDTALHHGANRVLGFEFYSTELRKHRDEARKVATRAAREKAELLATELGAKAGRVITISEGWNRFYQPYRSWWGWSNNYDNRSQNAVNEGADGAGAGSAPTGQIAISAGVMVSFELIR